MEKEKIIVLNVSGIGDFVDSVPAMRRLRGAKPDAAIMLVVSEKVFPLARNCPYVDEVAALPTGSGSSFPALRSLPRWLGAVYGLRNKFSMSIHLYEISSRAGWWWTWLLKRWIGAPVSIGRHSGGRGTFFTNIVEDLKGRSDEVGAYLNVVSQATPAKDNGRVFDEKFEVWVPEEAVVEVKRWLDGLSWGTLDGPMVLVSFGGDRVSRHELPDRAEEWLSALQGAFKIRPVLWGTLHDPGLADGTRIVRADARGRWDIVHSAAMFACVDAVITTHSAPQHLASAWNVPTVVLVGPGDEVRFRPHLSPDCMRMLRHPVPCAPCYYQDCPWSGPDYKKCLKGIPAQAIVEAFSYILPAVRQRMAVK